jgi:hypothetical protein
MSDVEVWVKVITDLGVAGVLLGGIWAFMTGKIVAASVVKERTDAILEIAKITLTEGFTSAVEEAVRKGFVSAWYEVMVEGKDAGQNGQKLESISRAKTQGHV